MARVVHQKELNTEIVADVLAAVGFLSSVSCLTLVTARELDFRVPYTQDLQLYTALQMQKVPSKLVVFPDEGHWILKRRNSELWYHTVLDWLASYTKKN